MADWRARNCVPDSEGEDEGLDDSQEKSSHHDQEPSDDHFVDINAIITSESNADSSSPSRKTSHDPSNQSTNNAGSARSNSESAQTLTEVSHGVEGGLLLQDEQNDELLAPLLPYLPASATNAKRPLKQLFTDDREPDELGREAATLTRSTPAKRPRLTSGASNSQRTQNPSSESQKGWDLQSSRPSRASSPLTALSSTRSTPPSLNTKRGVPHATNLARYARVFDVDEQGQPQQTGALSPSGPNNGFPTYKFRTRKAVQNHPYTIDNTRYKKTCESHAIPYERFQQAEKAARASGDAGSHHSVRGSYERDATEPGAEAGAPSRYLPRSSAQQPNLHTPIVTARVPPPKVSSIASLDHEFPEPSSPEPRSHRNAPSGSSKRRKIAHTYSSKLQKTTAARRGQEQEQRKAAEDTALQVLQSNGADHTPHVLNASSEINQESVRGTQPENSATTPMQFRLPRGFVRQDHQNSHTPDLIKRPIVARSDSTSGQEPGNPPTFEYQDSPSSDLEQADATEEADRRFAVLVSSDSEVGRWRPARRRPKARNNHSSESEKEGQIKQTQRRIVLLDLSDQETRRPPRDERLLEDRAGPSSGSEQEHQIRKAQRKVRKVLPASWITLNEKKRQAAVIKTQAQKKSRPGNESARGTARPILARDRPPTASSAEANDVLCLDASTSSSAETEQKSKHSRVPTPNRLQVPFASRQAPTSIQVDEDDDAMEDIFVDHMLPTSPRALKRRRRSKARQRKITDAFYSLSADEMQRSETAPWQRGTDVASNPMFGKRRRRKSSEAANKARSVQNFIDNVQAEFNVSKVAVRAARVRKAQFLENRSRNQTRAGLGKFLQCCKPDLRKKVSTRSRHAPARNPASREDERQPLALVNGNRRVAQTGLPGFESGGSAPEIPEDNVSGPYQAQSLLGKEKQKSKRDQGVLLTNLGGQRTIPALLEVPRVERGRFKSLHDAPNAPVKRFLQAMPAYTTSIGDKLNSDQRSSSRDAATGRRAPRKRIPKRGDPISTSQDSTTKQTDGATWGAARPRHDGEPPGMLPKGLLAGLGPYGIEYPVSFDIEPLPDGPCFNSSTLLGSGLVAKCLKMTGTLAMARHPTLSTSLGKYNWNAWTEVVSTDIQSIFDQIVNGLMSPSHLESRDNDGAGDLVESLSTIVRYVADHLYFLDSVDRKSFLGRLFDCLSRLIVAISDSLDPPNGQPEVHWAPRTFSIPVAVRGLLLAQQCCRIAIDVSVSTEYQESTEELLQGLLERTMSLILREGIPDFQLFSRSAQNLVSHTPKTITRIKAEAFVITLHIIENAKGRCISIWQHMARSGLIKLTAKGADVTNLDQQWRTIFILLPLFDVDEHGKTGRSRRRTNQRQNWDLVKQLIRPNFDVYLLNPTQQGATFNAYLRVVLTRCYQLINVWDWYNCEAILNTLFDFFAKINLGNLRYEDSVESPAFLENLAADPRLDCSSSDRSFHIFLKILCSGLRRMRQDQHYTRGKLASIGYRLIPNHDRQLVKDKAVKQEDLDALRNHHDLLVGLYWALPHGSGIPVHHIERLVDFRHSHKEACRINAKSWANLMCFRLSMTGEALETLTPFRGWLDQMLVQSLSLHKVARTEVESYAKSAIRESGRVISQGSQEAVIRSNQRELEALLCEILSSFQRAILLPSMSTAFSAAIPPSLGDVFTLFDPRQPRINNVLDAALNVILAFSQRRSELPERRNSQSAIPILPEAIQTALHGLLSNALGSDNMVHDPLLTKTIDAWVSVARDETQAANKTWDAYIGQHGQLSWNALRDTEQTRRATPYFYATVAEDQAIYEQHRLIFVTAWFESLVERESLLKFQHTLTTAILNRDNDDYLLKNLPFARPKDNALFVVVEDELRERRRHLLSCLFENMREALAGLPGADANRRRIEYSCFLTGLMAAMRRNYQNLGPDPNARDSYVAFAQDIVELLQHYTAEICSVDHFFLDPRTFPLPDADPDYIRGKLGNYGLRLREPGTPKILSSFIQGICYCAAVEGTGVRLADQLENAMTADLASKRRPGESLLFVMTHAILPAHITLALDTPCGWIVASPLLMALPVSLNRLAHALDGTDRGNFDVVQTTLMSLLWHIKRSASSALAQDGATESCSALHVLTTYVAIATAALRPLDYVLRLRGGAPSVIDMVKYFARLGDSLTLSILTRLDGSTSRVPFDPPNDDDDDWRPPAEDIVHRDTLAFTQITLRDDLRRDWRHENGRFFTIKGGKSEPVAFHLGNAYEESLCLVTQCQAFEETGAAMPAFAHLFHDERGRDF